MHELKQVYQRYFTTAVALAFVLHASMIAAALQWSIPVPTGRQIPVKIMPYMDLMQLEAPDESSGAPRSLPPPLEEPPQETKPPTPLSEILPVPDWMAVDSLIADSEIAPFHDIAQAPAGADAGGRGGTGGSVGGAGDSGVGDSAGGRIRVDAKPRWLKRVEPEYPRIAKLTGVEGVVILSVFIDESGQVTDTKVIKSLGNAGCDQAAEVAAKQWRFIPAKRDGEPLAMWFSVPVLFQLNAN